MTNAIHRPIPAAEHRSARSAARLTAVGMLTVYVVLLFAVPSNLSIDALGTTLGRPSLLWGLVLLLWWVLTRLQSRSEVVRMPRQPIRWALIAFAIVVLVSFSAAMLRGQPADQVTPAISAVIRLASWTGVVLVAMDGIRTHNDMVRLVKALVVAAGGVAALGIAQFVTGSNLIDWTGSIPGLIIDWGGIDSRGAFVRASGTATHPLEFVTSIIAILPMAIATAMTGGLRPRTTRRHFWWAAVVLIVGVCLISVSRSAIIGLVVAFVLFAPSLPRFYRWVTVTGGVLSVGAVLVLVPGMWEATVALFSEVADDPSTRSRTEALARVPEFLSSSPFIGQGWGTFLARYYIFDNQWVGVLLELGVAGIIALVFLVISASWSAAMARISPFADTRVLSGAITSGVLTMAILFLFFDGLGFPISAGVLFLLIGLAAAIRNIAVADLSLGSFSTMSDHALAQYEQAGGRAE